MVREQILRIYDYAKRVVLKAGLQNYISYIEKLLDKNFLDSLSLNDFFKQYVWVVFTCGFNASVVRKNWSGIRNVLHDFDLKKVKNISEEKLLETIPIKNPLKIASIIKTSKILSKSWLDRIKTAVSWEDVERKLLDLPHIGKTTVCHLMRNIGFDCYKPDRHIINLSAALNVPPEEIFQIIIDSGKEKYIGLADHILWRASSLLGVNSLIQYANKNKKIPKLDLSYQTTMEDMML